MANPVLYLIGVIAVVAMWRGLWGLMDVYLWPKNPKVGYWVSFAAGFSILSIIVLIIT